MIRRKGGGGGSSEKGSAKGWEGLGQLISSSTISLKTPLIPGFLRHQIDVIAIPFLIIVHPRLWLRLEYTKKMRKGVANHVHPSHAPLSLPLISPSYTTHPCSSHHIDSNQIQQSIFGLPMGCGKSAKMWIYFTKPSFYSCQSIAEIWCKSRTSS